MTFPHSAWFFYLRLKKKQAEARKNLGGSDLRLAGLCFVPENTLQVYLWLGPGMD